MPPPWPSMRSTARWVLPVLVGPSTAVTVLGDGIKGGFTNSLTPETWGACPGAVKVFCPVLNRCVREWIQTGTKLARIAAVWRFRFCSPRLRRSNCWAFGPPGGPVRQAGHGAIGGGRAGQLLNIAPLMVDGLLPGAGRRSPALLTQWIIPGTDRARIAEAPDFRCFVLARCCGVQPLSPQDGREFRSRQGSARRTALTRLCQSGTRPFSTRWRGGGAGGDHLRRGTPRFGLTPPPLPTIDPPSEPEASCRPVPILIVEFRPWPAVVS